MFWSIAPLVLACIVLAGVLGMCSFQGSGPAQGPAPSLRRACGAAGRRRRPQDPDPGARSYPTAGRPIPAAETASTAAAPTRSGERVRAVSSTVGYLAPSGMYVSLTQSNADEDKLVGSIESDLYPTGIEDVDGVTWVVYSGGDRDGRSGEPLWTTRLDGPEGPAQIAITGAATTEEFRTLAAATQTASPLPAD